MSWQIIGGDCRETLRALPAASAHTCVTSPPYLGLRDYGHDEQIGLEPTPSCHRQGMFKLRSDLTEAQREFVVRRLLDAGRPDA